MSQHGFINSAPSAPQVRSKCGKRGKPHPPHPPYRGVGVRCGGRVGKFEVRKYGRNGVNRTHLPNRRPHESIAFQFRGLAYIAGVGRFADGSPAEIFLDCSKASTPVANDARDVAVSLSIALQHKVPADAIRSAVTREADGRPSGIAGAVLDLLAEERP